jgi:hypothetical protein
VAKLVREIRKKEKKIFHKLKFSFSKEKKNRECYKKSPIAIHSRHRKKNQIYTYVYFWGNKKEISIQEKRELNKSVYSEKKYITCVNISA